MKFIYYFGCVYAIYLTVNELYSSNRYKKLSPEEFKRQVKKDGFIWNSDIKKFYKTYKRRSEDVSTTI